MARKKKKHHGLLKAATLVGAIGAAYYLYGAEQAERNRNKVKGWMLRAKGDVLSAVEKAENMDKERYNKIVDQVRTRYKKLKEVNSKEVDKLARDLKGHWEEVVEEAGRKPRTRRKKTTRKRR